MKQEPVGWTDECWTIVLNDEYCMLDEDMKKDMIPLYTTPRELSDDEIMKIWHQSLAWALNYESLENDMPMGVYFARAILKKASEK